MEEMQRGLRHRTMFTLSLIHIFLVSNLFLPLGSLVYLLFCVTKYGWGWDNYKKERCV